MTRIRVISSHLPIKNLYGELILGVNTLYRLFCFFKLFSMVGKGLTCYEKLSDRPRPNIVHLASQGYAHL